MRRDRYALMISPQRLEMGFEARWGKWISDDYLDHIETFFLGIHNKIGTLMRVQSLWCDLIAVKEITCDPSEKFVIVHEIFVRPCAWGLGFFRLLLLQLIYSCRLKEMSLCILNPSDELKQTIKNICPQFQEEEGEGENRLDYRGHVIKNFILDSGDMGAVSAATLQINNLLTRVDKGGLVLKRSSFPSSQQLNNPTWVSGRHSTALVRSSSSSSQ